MANDPACGSWPLVAGVTGVSHDRGERLSVRSCSITTRVNSFRCQPGYSGMSRLLTLDAIHACRSATAVPACSAVVQFPAVPQRPVLVPAGDGQQPRLGQRLDIRLLHIQTGPRSALLEFLENL
jgi:hypothetical protein